MSKLAKIQSECKPTKTVSEKCSFFQFILNYLFDRRNQLVFYVNEFVFEDVLLGVQS